MAYSVYILYSRKDKRLYVGCTSNLAKRLKRHENGYVPATKYRLPKVLIHREELESKSDAFNRERFFKSLWSAREKKKLLKKYLEEVECVPEHILSDKMCSRGVTGFDGSFLENVRRGARSFNTKNWRALNVPTILLHAR